MALAAIKSTKNALKNLRRELKDQHSQSAEAVAKSVQKEAEKLLSKTLEFANSGSGAFADAKPVVKYDIKTTDKGARIEFRIYMGDSSKSPHYVWHLLQFGIPARTQKKTSPPLNAIESPRTTPDRMTVEPYKGTGETFVIRAGTQIKATPPRNWYQTLESDLRSYIKKNHDSWTIESTQVNKP